MERHIEQIVTACKEAGQHPEGIALYKVGKNPGLFTSKTGPSGEAATQALESGYLELLRTDNKAETVRLTPRGEAFLKEHLDPKATTGHGKTEGRIVAITLRRDGAERCCQWRRY